MGGGVDASLTGTHRSPKTMFPPFCPRPRHTQNASRPFRFSITPFRFELFTLEVVDRGQSAQACPIMYYALIFFY